MVVVVSSVDLFCLYFASVEMKVFDSQINYTVCIYTYIYFLGGIYAFICTQ